MKSGVCAYCDRRAILKVGGEPRCDWHVTGPTGSYPKRVLIKARARGRQRKRATT